MRGAVDVAIQRYGRDRVGVVMGSSTSGIEEGEDAVRSLAEGSGLPERYAYSQQQMGTVSEVISRVLDVRGPSYTISTACSSSAKIFRAADNLIQAGLCDCVVAGGFDSLCKLTTNGFSALELVSDEITNPFSKNRKGITIGEGGAIFLLERRDKGQVQEDAVYVGGVGESSDAYHISSPDPTAAGAVTAIRAALSQASVRPEEIGYINLHGTGTPHNDSMEALAIRQVFSEAVPCSSTKPLVGHMLGASGATEAAFCWMVLRDSARRLPPHLFDGVVDPALPPLHFAGKDARGAGPLRYALSNSFGFGGSNCAVVLRRGAP
jgi:3-oxoacyl-[acyl-carrier-protein] synthase-1